MSSDDDELFLHKHNISRARVLRQILSDVSSAQLPVNLPDRAWCNGKQRMIQLVLLRQQRITHCPRPVLPQITDNIAIHPVGARHL